MAIKNIERWSFRYFLLKGYGKFMHNQVFYRKVEVIGRENIPLNEPVIFAANHQNALMDALAILYNIKGQPVFLARSDIFKNPLTAKFLTFIKMLPIYRIRDGKSELKKNDEIFNATIGILQNNKYLAILPEGNHAGVKKLRALKKGISRIAFQAEEISDFELGLNILPVGLDYGHYSNFRSRLFVNFGKPFKVADFAEMYKENPQKGMNELRKQLAEHLKPLMIHISNDEHYEEYLTLLDVLEDSCSTHFNIDNKTLAGKFTVRKKIIASLDHIFENNRETFDEIVVKAKRYKDLLDKMKIRDWIPNKRSFNFFYIGFRALLYLIFFPLQVYGVAFNYIPYYLPVYLTRKVKDPQFLSSFRYVISLITFFVFFLIMAIIFGLIVKSWLWVLLFIISLPLSGIFAFHYFIGIKKLNGILRFKKRERNNDVELTEAINLRQELNESFIPDLCND